MAIAGQRHSDERMLHPRQGLLEKGLERAKALARGTERIADERDLLVVELERRARGGPLGTRLDTRRCRLHQRPRAHELVYPAQEGVLAPLEYLAKIRQQRAFPGQIRHLRALHRHGPRTTLYPQSGR